MTPTISIVTCWLNHTELADDYFEAVLPELQAGDTYIIVDNASNPPLKFATYQCRINMGFCGGSNLGLRKAKTDAVVFCNNDVKRLREGWLSEIREALEPGVLCGPLRFERHADVDGHGFPYIDGWCLAGMRQDFIALGGWPKIQEPAYYSDNLLCLEARAQGMTLRDVRVGLLHKENVTAGSASLPEVREATEANRAIYVARARSILAAA